MMSLFKPRFRLVTFDVTNTILKFRTSVGDQYAKAAKLFGVESDPVKIQGAFKVQWKLMTAQYPNFGKHAGFSSQEWWKKMIHSSFLNAECKLSDRQLTALSSYLYQLYATDKCWEVPCDVRKHLDFLREHEVIIGAISNFDERLESVLQSTGLRSYFQFVLASYVVNHSKPSKEIFELALRSTGKVNIAGHEAIHIGDNYKLDFLAAKNAGWHALLLQQQQSREKVNEFLDAEIERVSNFDDICKFILQPNDQI